MVTRTPSSRISRLIFHNRLNSGHSAWKKQDLFEFWGYLAWELPKYITLFKTCVHLGRCYGNQGRAETVEDQIFLFKIRSVKGSGEISLLPSAIFLIFTQNRPWTPEDQLCTLFLMQCQRKHTKRKRKKPARLVASLGASVQQWSTIPLFMAGSDVEKQPWL